MNVNDMYSLFFTKFNMINEELMREDDIKICVQVHLYYLDLIDEIIYNLNFIPFPFHCFISSDTDEKIHFIQNEFNKRCKNAKKIIAKKYENRGRDIGPFLEQIGNDIGSYEYLLHIHSKKNFSSYGNGNKWRKYLYKHLLGSTKNIYHIFNEFYLNENLGLIFPETFHLIIKHMIWGSEIEKAKKNVDDFLKRIGVSIELSGKPEFPSGNMFWARIKSIKKMFNANIKQDDFPVENNQRDMTLAHVIERSWIYVAKSEGYTYKQLNNSNLSLIFGLLRGICKLHFLPV